MQSGGRDEISTAVVLLVRVLRPDLMPGLHDVVMCDSPTATLLLHAPKNIGALVVRRCRKVLRNEISVLGEPVDHPNGLRLALDGFGWCPCRLTPSQNSNCHAISPSKKTLNSSRSRT